MRNLETTINIPKKVYVKISNMDKFLDAFNADYAGTDSAVKTSRVMREMGDVVKSCTTIIPEYLNPSYADGQNTIFKYHHLEEDDFGQIYAYYEYVG